MNAEYEEGVGRIATDGIWEVSLGPRADQLGGERVLIASNEEGTAVRVLSAQSRDYSGS